MKKKVYWTEGSHGSCILFRKKTIIIQQHHLKYYFNYFKRGEGADFCSNNRTANVLTAPCISAPYLLNTLTVVCCREDQRSIWWQQWQSQDPSGGNRDGPKIHLVATGTVSRSIWWQQGRSQDPSGGYRDGLKIHLVATGTVSRSIWWLQGRSQDPSGGNRNGLSYFLPLSLWAVWSVSQTQ